MVERTFYRSQCFCSCFSMLFLSLFAFLRFRVSASRALIGCIKKQTSSRKSEMSIPKITKYIHKLVAYRKSRARLVIRM